jgi:hypothetical protein
MTPAEGMREVFLWKLLPLIAVLDLVCTISVVEHQLSRMRGWLYNWRVIRTCAAYSIVLNVGVWIVAYRLPLSAYEYFCGPNPYPFWIDVVMGITSVVMFSFAIPMVIWPTIRTISRWKNQPKKGGA